MTNADAALQGLTPAPAYGGESSLEEMKDEYDDAGDGTFAEGGAAEASTDSVTGGCRMVWTAEGEAGVKNRSRVTCFFPL